MSVDIREDEFDVLTLYGAHNNERNMDSGLLVVDGKDRESERYKLATSGTFMALLRKGADEDRGRYLLRILFIVVTSWQKYK